MSILENNLPDICKCAKYKVYYILGNMNCGENA